MDLRTVADELYAVAPGDFVAERAAAAKEADRELAKQIKALRKPSAAAAAINALVRERGEVIQDVLDVGDRMREAFADRDRGAIRELTQQRQRVLQRAIKGLDLSASVQREVEETLQAAVIDPAAAAAVRSGLLVRALESTGVDQVDIADAVALPIEVEGPGEEAASAPEKRSTATKSKAARGPARSATSTSTRNAEPGRERPAKSTRKPAPEPETEPEAEPEPEPAESASDRRERQRRLRAAEKAVERAREDAVELDDELDEEVDRRTDLEAERDSLERRLQRVADELADSKAAERDLRKRVAAAQSALRDAERALRALTPDD